MIYDPPQVGTRGISVRALLSDEELQIEVRVVAGGGGLERCIRHPRIQKSGLAMVGHLHGLVPTRVQILGETELSFVESLSAETRKLLDVTSRSLEAAAYVRVSAHHLPHETTAIILDHENDGSLVYPQVVVRDPAESLSDGCVRWDYGASVETCQRMLLELCNPPRLFFRPVR